MSLPVLTTEASPAKVWAAITQPELMMQWHLPDEEARKSHEDGWKGLLDKLPVLVGDT